MKGIIVAILVAVIAVAVAMALLCVRVIVKKNGRFSSQHIGQNKRMQQAGIHCAVSQDRESRKDAEKRLKVKEL